MNKEETHEELTIKFIVIGDINVGKTCIIHSYKTGEFPRKVEPTIAISFSSRTIEYEDKEIKLQIWDTAGQEEYMSLTKSYYRSSAAAIIVFDYTKRSSFENLDKWLKDLMENANRNIVLALIGSKIDIPEEKWEVSRDEAEEYAERTNMFFMECSAMRGIGVKDVFNRMLEKVMFKVKMGDLMPDHAGLDGIRLIEKGKDGLRRKRQRGFLDGTRLEIVTESESDCKVPRCC